MTTHEELRQEVADLIKAERKLKSGSTSVILTRRGKFPFAVKRGCDKILCTSADSAAENFIRYAGQAGAEKAVKDIERDDNLAYQQEVEDSEAASERAAEQAMSAHSLGIVDEPLTREEESDVRQCEADFFERPAIGPDKASVKWYVSQPYARTFRPIEDGPDTAEAFSNEKENDDEQ